MFVVLTTTREGVHTQLHTPNAVLPGLSTQHPLNRRLRTHRSQSGRSGQENIHLLLPGIEPRFKGCPDRSVFTVQNVSGVAS